MTLSKLLITKYYKVLVLILVIHVRQIILLYMKLQDSSRILYVVKSVHALVL